MELSIFSIRIHRRPGSCSHGPALTFVYEEADCNQIEARVDKFVREEMIFAYMASGHMPGESDDVEL
jgi:hypothetical protein